MPRLSRPALIRRLRELRKYYDFLTLALLAVIVGAVWGFVELADEMREGELHRIDMRILHLFRDAGNPNSLVGPRWFQELMRDATAMGGVLVLTLLSVAVIVTLWMEKHRTAATWLAAAVLGALAISTLLKNLFERARPELLGTELLPTSFSFPSGHSFLSAAVYLTIGALLTRVIEDMRTRVFVLLVAMSLTVLVGFSRVYLGVHYPSDVLAGWTLGLCWAALCWLVVWSRQKYR